MLKISCKTIFGKMYATVIYSVILHLLHTLYGFLKLIRNTCLYCTKIWFKDNDVERLSLELKNLKKKPHHMVLVLGNEEPSYRDLANIVLWSAIAGIPIISLYDHNGILKHTKQKLYVELDRYNIKYNKKGPLRKLLNGHENGTSHSSIHVNILSMSDGQNSVAEVIKSCALNNVKDFEIGIEYVDQELRKRIGEFPDPELALYCGPICSSYGLLPWQIRLTEFVDIITHHEILLSKFKTALQRYDKSEQRFGK